MSKGAIILIILWIIFILFIAMDKKDENKPPAYPEATRYQEFFPS